MPSRPRPGRLSQERLLQNLRNGVSQKHDYSAFELLRISHEKLEYETRRQEPRLRQVVGHIKTWENVKECYQADRKGGSVYRSGRIGEQRRPTYQPSGHCEVIHADVLPISPMICNKDHVRNTAQSMRVDGSAKLPFFTGVREEDEESDEESSQGETDYDSSDEDSSEEDSTEYCGTNALFSEDGVENEGNSSQSSLSSWGLDWPSGRKPTLSVSIMKTSERLETLQQGSKYRQKVQESQASLSDELDNVSLDCDLWARQPKLLSKTESEELLTEKHWS